jgi:hypothetical protein
MKPRRWQSIFLVTFVLGVAQGAKEPYPKMAPVDQYLMADRSAEIALARSAAPESISLDARVMVLGSHGYETAVEGKNGFVCVIERSWANTFDSAEFWNPKMRAPTCFNPAAARSILPYSLKRTELVLAGLSKSQVLDGIKAAVDKKELPGLEPGAMSYMMSKLSVLGDSIGHWTPHVMFYVAKTDGASWGADLPGSPVMLNPVFQGSLEPASVLMVPVRKWSDGTAFGM